jgi:hypothetical protein
MNTYIHHEKDLNNWATMSLDLIDLMIVNTTSNKNLHYIQ